MREDAVSTPLRVHCASIDAAGHVLPTLALAARLRERGHDVTLQTGARWREIAERAGVRFEEATAPAPLDPGAGGVDAGERAPAAPDVCRELAARFRADETGVVVTDPFAFAPALAGEAAGARVATLVPDPLYMPAPGMPLFAQGLFPARTAAGRAAWRAGWPLMNVLRRRDRARIDELRAGLGLGPARGIDSTISPELVLVATFPQLEFPRRWPSGVHVIGPLAFEIPAPDPEVPAGNGPLVVVVPTTTDVASRRAFVQRAIDALAGEPVRVLATLSRRGERWPHAKPDGVEVVDWLSPGGVLGDAAAMLCHGGHGSVAAALSAGVPVLAAPVGGNTKLTAARVAWSGAGAMIPPRLSTKRALRAGLRRLLADDGYAARAREIASWSRRNDAASRAAGLVETLVPARDQAAR